VKSDDPSTAEFGSRQPPRYRVLDLAAYGPRLDIPNTSEHISYVRCRLPCAD